MKTAGNRIPDTVILILSVLALALSHLYFSTAIIDQFRFPKLFIQMILLSVAVLVFIISRFFRLIPAFSKKLFYFLYLFLVFALISHLLSGSAGEGILYLAVAYIHVLFFIALVNILGRNRTFFRLIFVSMIIISVLISIYAFLQVLNLDPIFKISGERLEYYRITRFAPTGFTGNTNIFSGTMISAIPMLFCLMLYARKKSRIFLWISAGLMLVPLIVSMTRGVIAGILIAFAFTVIKKRHTRTAIVLIILLTAAFSVYLVTSESMMRERIESTLTLKELGIKYRLNIYYISFRIIGDHPLFGTGPNTFYRVFSQYKYRYLQNHPDLHEDAGFISLSRTFPEQAHNDILQNISELGIIPNIFLLIFFISIMLKKHGESNEFFRLLGVSVPESSIIQYLKLSIIIFLINSFFNFPFHFAASGINFTLTVGLLCSLLYKKIDK